MLCIGIDLGTSAVKLLPMGETGDIKNIVPRECPLEFPKPGWSQQNPKDWEMAVKYGRSIGFTGDFYIEPKPKEPMQHQYDFDAATAIALLRQYGLDKDFKMNIEAKNRRPSYTHEDMFHAYILGMDAFTLGLEKAAKLIEDGRIDDFIAERYSSYNSGIGAKIRSGETSPEELAAYAESMGKSELPGSGRQEYLESIVNNVLFAG